MISTELTNIIHIILLSSYRFHAWTPTLELQTKTAIEITPSFQKNNIEYLQPRSLKKRWQQDYNAGRKNPEVQKN